jgi:hypothetical protein
VCRANGKVESAIFPGVDSHPRLSIALIDGSGLDTAMGVDYQVGCIFEDGDESLGRVLCIRKMCAAGHNQGQDSNSKSILFTNELCR